MSDSTNPVDNALENLVLQYEDGVENLDNVDLALLNTRDQIEARFSELSAEQAERIEDADAELTKNAGQVAAKLAASGNALRDQRKVNNRAPEQWWWYLDVLSHVSDEIGTKSGGESSNFSRIVTIVELVVLGIAILLLIPNLPNLIQRIIPQASPVAATAFPSWTPAPAATLDPAALDFSSATLTKSATDVVEIMLPKGWKAAPETEPNRFLYSFGEETNPTASVQLVIDTPDVVYSQALGLQVPPKDAVDAFDQLRKTANAQFKFGATTDTKIGTLDAKGMAVSIPGSPQSAPVELEIRVANLDQGKIAFVITQAGAERAQQVLPLLNQIVGSIKINLGNIPTPTPTNTPHPLELTATAIENMAATNRAQILALTPSPTPSPTVASTADAAATQAAPTPSAAATEAAPATQAATP
jgi:hypothetical protein